jgi:hypothetical protein
MCSKKHRPPRLVSQECRGSSTPTLHHRNVHRQRDSDGIGTAFCHFVGGYQSSVARKEEAQKNKLDELRLRKAVLAALGSYLTLSSTCKPSPTAAKISLLLHRNQHVTTCIQRMRETSALVDTGSNGTSQSNPLKVSLSSSWRIRASLFLGLIDSLRRLELHFVANIDSAVIFAWRKRKSKICRT